MAVCYHLSTEENRDGYPVKYWDVPKRKEIAMRQRSLLDMEIIRNTIESYRETFGEMPTVSEVSNATRISRSAVGRYMKLMKEQGEFESRGARGYISREEQVQRSMCQIPILGEVSCGLRKLAVEDVMGYVAMPKEYLGGGKFYVLIADGESMRDIGIHTGDLVLIRDQDYADSGQVVVALDDNDEATLKRYIPHLTQGYVDLVPENSEFPVQRIDLSAGEKLTIQGVAVKVIKDIL